MIEMQTFDTRYPSITDGEIAINNFESARRNAWNRFWRQPQRMEVAEYILELENLALQFLGDLSALHRLGDLVRGLGGPQLDPAHTSLVRAQVASTLHHVLESRRQTAESSGRLEELVPLGALLADLGHFDEADDLYARALREYKDVSPFAVAWVCFQRGVCGENGARKHSQDAPKNGIAGPSGTCRAM